VSGPSESATRSLRCHAPAKINLGLRVVGRRDDGYHELVSLFAPLDFGDEIEIEVSQSDALEVEIKLEGGEGAAPADASNLGYRAAQAFAEAAGLHCRIALRIEKRVPVGAGLGGGSSDAGAVLRALSDLYPGAVDGSRLAEIALGLGADVPFFLDPRPTRVTGIGERLEAVDGLPSLPVLLANPGIGLSTADVFRTFAAIQPALTKSASDRRIPPLSEPTSPGWTFKGVAGLSLENDLEPIAVRLCPPIGRLQRQLEAAGAQIVGMSGSGATVFGLFESAEAAERALEKAAFQAPVWARVAATQESR
jgi:4-diphosphocytidyl-2-C-methyl-D-erythritol kinase